MNRLQPGAHACQYVSFQQQLHRQKAWPLMRDARVWLAVWNRAGLLCLLAFSLLAWLSLAGQDVDRSIVAVENVRQELIREQIALRAERDRLRAPELMLKTAADRLALYVPDRERMIELK